MIIVQVVGGLGNQMFQYAYAKGLKAKGFSVKLDITVFEHYKLHGGYQLGKYNIDIDIATNSEIQRNNKYNFCSKLLYFLNINAAHRVKEKRLLFQRRLLQPNNHNYIEGYFQCEKYFLSIREDIIESFKINSILSDYTQEIEKKISKAKTSCSLHVRRGDYISDKDAQKTHGTCTLAYYAKALDQINQQNKEVEYFIFSDDIAWVKENLKVDNAFYIESKEERVPHEDIYLMSLCTHNIIANSSFSWWGAWLNNNENKIVLAPLRWFANEKMFLQSKDIVSSSWIKL